MPVLSILIIPSEDVPGLWVSHCLDMDLISQGDNPNKAFRAIMEGVVMMAEDDLSNDLDPLGRDKAPQEDWDRFDEIWETECQGRLPEDGSLAMRIDLPFRTPSKGTSQPL